ncbi:hypothetical protein EV424DRAFT_925814 [Suillus variegatus]|nr:hypothetical protein EV424DRAFT_925814 [Suillus variegatus]
MTYSHLGLNLGSGGSASPSSSAQENSQRAQTTRPPHSQHLPSPPSTQVPGPSTSRQQVQSSSTQQPSTSTPRPPSSSAASPSSAVPGAASHPSTNQATPPTVPNSQQASTAQPSVQHPNVQQPVANLHQPAAAVPTQPPAAQVAAPAVAQPDPAAQRRLAERAALQARLLQLDTEEANGAQPPANAPPIPPLALFADPATVEQARATAAALHVESKKISLPDLIPGFKANPLDASKYPSLTHRRLHIVAYTSSQAQNLL